MPQWRQENPFDGVSDEALGGLLARLVDLESYSSSKDWLGWVEFRAANRDESRRRTEAYLALLMLQGPGSLISNVLVPSRNVYEEIEHPWAELAAYRREVKPALEHGIVRRSEEHRAADGDGQGASLFWRLDEPPLEVVETAIGLLREHYLDGHLFFELRTLGVLAYLSDEPGVGFVALPEAAPSLPRLCERLSELANPIGDSEWHGAAG